MYTGLHVKYPLFLSDLKLQFYQQNFEKSSNIKSHKICPVEAELFHAARQMNRHDEANSCFPSFVNTPKSMLCCFMNCSPLPTMVTNDRRYKSTASLITWEEIMKLLTPGNLSQNTRFCKRVTEMHLLLSILNLPR